jgi:hypothetical protein
MLGFKSFVAAQDTLIEIKRRHLMNFPETPHASEHH